MSREWRENHREHLTAYHKAYYWAHREEMLAKAKAWRDRQTPAQLSARKHAWAVKNRDKVRALRNLHRHRYPELSRWRHKVTGANRAAARWGAPGRIKFVDIKYFGRSCVFCGSTERLALDHATPLSRGGENHWSNLTVACFRCNLMKGTSTITEFRARVAA